VGELPMDLQPKLLRALESGEIRRVGETEPIQIDVRLIAATNRDLAVETQAGRFRQDLYYRLAVLTLELPPLRHRREDILLVARKMATEISSGRVDRLPASAEDFFVRYDWPGNVRELRNAVHRMLTLGSLPPAAKLDLPEHPQQSSGGLHSYRRARESVVNAFELAFLRDLMARFGDNLSAAARAAEMDRKHLRQLMRKHGLYKKDA